MSRVAVVADDDADILMLLKLRLERAGWEVSAHANGTDALKAAESERPQLLLLDVMMPQLTGLQVLEAVRSHRDSAVAETPIILLTASVQEEHETKALAAGADHYMRKPFDPRELLGAVERVTSGRG